MKPTGVLRSLPVLLLGTLLTIGCGKGPRIRGKETAPHQAGRAQALRIGTVSRNPAEEHRSFSPFMELLSRVQDRWRPELVVRDHVEEMAAALAEGTVDLYMDSSFPVMEVARRSGARVVLLWRKHGLERYSAVFFTRRDSGVLDLAGLRGRTLVLSAPESTSGFLLPLAALAGAGVPFDAPGFPGPDDGVRVVLSGDAENTVFWVLEGKGTAGAVADEYVHRLAGIREPELRVLATTPSVPRALVCVRPEMQAETAAQLVTMLSSLGRNPATAGGLRAFHGTTGFSPVRKEDLAGTLRMLALLDARRGP